MTMRSVGRTENLRKLILTSAILLVALLIYPLFLFSQTRVLLSVDLDDTAGNQAVTSLNVLPDQVISIQVFGKDTQDASGVSFRFEYDASQVVYDGFDTNGVLPDIRVLPILGTNQKAVKINIAFPGDFAITGSRPLGRVRFRATNSFIDTHIRLLHTDSGQNEQIETVTLQPNTTLLSGSNPDFDRDGMVGFSDFLLFSKMFGTSRGDGKYEAIYDLDEDGTIGVEDFSRFNTQFGIAVSDADTTSHRAKVLTKVGVTSTSTQDQQLAEKFAPILLLHAAEVNGEPYVAQAPESVNIVGANDWRKIWFNVKGMDANNESLSPVEISASDWKDNFIGTYYPNRSPNGTGINYSSGSYTNLNTEFEVVARWNSATYRHLTGRFKVKAHFDFAGPKVNGSDFDDNDSPTGSWERSYESEKDNFNNTIYAHIFEETVGGNSRTVIQYWFFYPYDDWINNHEGDWEHINVILSCGASATSCRNPATAVADTVEFYFHGLALKRKAKYGNNGPAVADYRGVDPEVPLVGHRPLVYVGGGSWFEAQVTNFKILDPIVNWVIDDILDSDSGLQSGASYPYRAFWFEPQGGVPATDNVEYPNGLGEIIDVINDDKSDLVLIPGKTASSAPDWLKADIKWGHLVVDSPGGTRNKAPEGPAYKGNWQKTIATESVPSTKIYNRKPLISSISSSNIPIRFTPPIVLGDQTWSGNITIYGDITVLPGTTLTISSGATVKFIQNADINQTGLNQHGGSDFARPELNIKGTLIANGVTFQSEPLPNASRTNTDWSGIVVSDGGSVELSNCTIQNATPGITNYGEASLTNCTIQNNETGIANYGNLTMTGGVIRDASIGLWPAELESARKSELQPSGRRMMVDLDDVEFINNIKGINITSEVNSISLDGIEMDNNYTGIWIENIRNTLSIQDVEIHHSRRNGIYIYDANVTIENALIYSNGNRGIEIEPDTYKNYNATTTLNNVTIADNAFSGVRVSQADRVTDNDGNDNDDEIPSLTNENSVKLIVNNSIIANNCKNCRSHDLDAGIYVENNSHPDTTVVKPVIKYSNIWGNSPNYGETFINSWNTSPNQSPNIGNISIDPSFDDEYKITNSLGGINLGDPATNMNDPDGTRRNMGRYGGTNEAEKVSTLRVDSISDKNFEIDEAITPIQVRAYGGQTPYRYSMSELDGITINSSTGLISGTPGDDGNFTMTVTVTDNNGSTVSTTFQVYVEP